MWMKDVNYYFGPTPRCLEAFTALPVSVPGALFDGHGSPHNSVVALYCCCGSGRYVGHGFREPGEHPCDDLLFDPLALECATCGTRADLFDSDAHGYDAQQGLFTGRHKDESLLAAVYACPCGGQAFEAFARFEYAPWLLKDDSPRYAGRKHEMFSWFTLLGICGQCHLLQLVAHFETA